MKRRFFLFLSVLISIILSTGNIESKNITGKISSAGIPITGVVVTDGTNFAVTNKKGD